MFPWTHATAIDSENGRLSGFWKEKEIGIAFKKDENQWKDK